MAGRCLIVANQTLGGEALDEAVEDCISRDVRRFHVVTPVTRVDHETTAWTGGFGLSEGGAPPERVRAAVEADAKRYQSQLDEARERARRRLDLMIDKIESLGGEAAGEVGVDDPLAATRTVLEREPPFDEIIVSTLPARLSHWLRMDLPNRIARITDVPVTTIEAKADAPA